MPTAGEIQSRLILATGRIDLSSEILSHLNELIAEITIEFNMPLQEQIKTRATVVGQDRYAIPSDMVDWKAFYIVDTDGITETELTVRSRGELEVIYGLDLTTAARGLPEVVAYERQEFVLRPVPDVTTYTLRLHYYVIPAALTQNDSNTITQRWANVLQTGVLSRLYLQMGNEKLYDFWNKQYQFFYDKMKLALRKQQLQSLPTLAATGGSRLSPPGVMTRWR